MYCGKCRKHLGKCICPDIEERMKALADHPVVGFAVRQNQEYRKKKQETKSKEV